MNVLPTENREYEVGVASPGAAFSAPRNLPARVRDWLDDKLKVVRIRDSRIAELMEEYDGDPGELERKYKPDNVKAEFWTATRALMLHMNTTQIAMRSFAAVYAGSQTRRVTGAGRFVSEVNEFANSPEWKAAAALHFHNAILCGTSWATPTHDDEAGRLDVVLHDPVRTHYWTDPANVKRGLGLVEFDAAGRFARFQTRQALGILRPRGASDVTVFEGEGLPWLPVAVAYGDDRRSVGDRYGRSRVRQTAGFNRILTHAYYALGLLIKWQSRSLLVISGGDAGGESAMPKRFRQVAGNTAMLLDKDGKAEFISPNAKFAEILEVINSYLTFLAVSIGLPKSVFLPQDNVSAQSARLEGAPLISTLRGMARQFEGYEAEVLLRAAGVLHLRRGEVLSLAALREQYQVSVRLDPWDYTDDLPTTAGTLVNLVANGLMRFEDAVRRVNPELTDEEVAELSLEGAEQARSQAAVRSGAGAPPLV